MARPSLASGFPSEGSIAMALHARLNLGCQRASEPYRLDEMEELVSLAGMQLQDSTSYTSGLVHLGGRLALHATGDAGGQPMGIAGTSYVQRSKLAVKMRGWLGGCHQRGNIGVQR